MRDIVLVNDKKVDIRNIFIEYLRANNIEEFYEKKLKGKLTTVYVFSFETSYSKALYGNKTPIQIFATTTVIATIKDNTTEVSLVLGSDDKNDVRTSLFLYLRDRGFYTE